MGVGGYFTRDDSRDAGHIRALQMGIDHGMTLIDTAEVYGAGHSEELVGSAIRGRRPEIFVATKFSPEHSRQEDVLRSAEESLGRLGTDYLDLYQTHWPNPRVPFEETLRALSELLESGKVRYVGLCNPTMKQVRQAREALGARLVSLQQQYNLADRFVEYETLGLCGKANLTLLAYSPLLEGKVAPEDARNRVLEHVARKQALTVGQVALLWLLRHPEVVVIPKAGREEHVLANARCGEAVLSPEDLDAISRAYEMYIIRLTPDAIDVVEAANRTVYKTVQEAIENRAGMTPSPAEVADEFRAGEPCKPVKVKAKEGIGKPYVLVEGRLRYWGWVIAFGGTRPVPCMQV